MRVAQSVKVINGAVYLRPCITEDLKVRFATHASLKTWWPQVARKTAELHSKGLRVDALVELVMMEMPPQSLRLALLELVGIPTSAALDMLGVRRENRSRVINHRKTARRVARPAKVPEGSQPGYGQSARHWPFGLRSPPNSLHQCAIAQSSASRRSRQATPVSPCWYAGSRQGQLAL